MEYDDGKVVCTATLVRYLDGGNVRPVITPGDTDRVAAVLSVHGVNVTAGREPGLI